MKYRLFGYPAVRNTRSGSALLIVLGLMSFIIVSAFAFSAYMRYARLPSSFLRRTSSSRLLVKAALAEAIELIDASIGNNPYPGVGSTGSRKPYGITSSSFNRNIWDDRVFRGTNCNVGVDSTVSTLCMEGLAYIPPAYVNPVRYYSRHTPSASWISMSFDAGRFAFCAVDVSDCLDVNRLMAGSARSSADNGRITLSHCFENPAHTDYAMDPEEWDKFMSEFDNGTGTKVPLVSVADLNLAVGQRKPGGLDYLSPFCSYLAQETNAKFVNPKTEIEREVLAYQAFITDSYFTPTNRAADAIDLSRAGDQPFAGLTISDADDEKVNDDTVTQLFRIKNKFTSKYGAHLQRPERIQLYDYLDKDSVPLSLAMPTVERTPMVTGVRLDGRVALLLGEARSETIDIPGGASSRLEIKARDLMLNIAALKAQASFAYPFKYRLGTKPKYKAQAAVTITFVRAGSERNLRLDEPKHPAIFERTSWTQSHKAPALAKYASEETPVVVTMQSALKDIQDLNAKVVQEEKDAVLDTVDFDFESTELKFVGTMPRQGVLANVTLPDSVAKTTFLTAQRMTKDPTTGNYVPAGNPAFFSSFRPSKPGLDGILEQTVDGERYVPVMQVWIRIVDENQQVVDLVPACYKDDMEETADLARLSSSRERPLVRFFASENADVNAAPIVNAREMMDFEGLTFDIYPKAYLADDPRFNYAPENLVACKAADIPGDFKTAWFDKQRSTSRDGDIFMLTSDVGYLQSIYELTALVDCCGLDGGTDASVVDSSAFDGVIRTDYAKLAGGDAMWRTYSQYKTPDEDGGDITRNFDVISGNRGFRVNPFTRDPNIMMAALVNTPLNWWAAATNVVNDTSKKDFVGTPVRGREVLDLDGAAPYTINEFSDSQLKVRHGSAKNADGTLYQVAQNLMSQFTQKGAEGKSWESVFDDENNWNAQNGVMGVDLGVKLHAIDRKFLNGFWRECFANRQQLFLIFVRAEPMMMGGGAVHQTPPQLGARAVALVWRDPYPTLSDRAGGERRPHRTRVLFYRQFE